MNPQTFTPSTPAAPATPSATAFATRTVHAPSRTSATGAIGLGARREVYAQHPSRSATSSPGAARRVLGPLRRIASIARAEVTLYLRNPTIVATALLLVPVVVLGLSQMIGGSLTGSAFASAMIQTLAVWALCVGVYYNLTVIYVARREEGVLQRMSTGEATPWEAVIAAVVPSGLVALVQAGVGSAAILALMQVTQISNPILLVVALLGGIVVLAGLAAWTSSWTSTVEGAQYSTMPVFVGLSVLSGGLVPISSMPEAMRTFSSYSPLWAMSDLIDLGLTGSNLLDTVTDASFAQTWAAAFRPAMVLVCWAIIACVLGSKMRFTRRR
ncbi:ABC transporter permease [Schaalia sp. 19OD2882]|uniref:ABC transporter permease n=1 Tax=Schaalia sp. 19OD2882 TaxID=2794089 RepID=UPI001C1EB8C9|nr:ABC transporter permease [Schaalia sp. 19OD2882]QWW19708.1 ABC transporter permease [Schaalia sp. 19OD2882]